MLVRAAAGKKVVIAQTAPAVRVSLGEELGMEPGQAVTGKMVTALKEVRTKQQKSAACSSNNSMLGAVLCAPEVCCASLAGSLRSTRRSAALL